MKTENTGKPNLQGRYMELSFVVNVKRSSKMKVEVFPKGDLF